VPAVDAASLVRGRQLEPEPLPVFIASPPAPPQGCLVESPSCDIRQRRDKTAGGDQEVHTRRSRQGASVSHLQRLTSIGRAGACLSSSAEGGVRDGASDAARPALAPAAVDAHGRRRGPGGVVPRMPAQAAFPDTLRERKAIAFRLSSRRGAGRPPPDNSTALREPDPRRQRPRPQSRRPRARRHLEAPGWKPRRKAGAYRRPPPAQPGLGKQN
jgi:hypothetical protein